MTTCAYPDCENEAEFECVVCRQRFCAFHTYQNGGYVCKTHFNEPTFVDPHAAKNRIADSLEALSQWLDRLVERLRR